MAVDQRVRRLIIAKARKYGVDPSAALAVAMGEGGIRWGAVGDNGTSFGPFQLHVGGALPKGKGAKWANSPAGIDYALRKMAESGAKGLTGADAVNVIVRRFERPADPDTSVANAIGRLGKIPAPKPSNMPTATATAGSSGVPVPAQAFGTLNDIFQKVGLKPLDIVGNLPLPTPNVPGQRTATPSPKATAAPAPPSGFVAPIRTPMPKGSEFGVPDPEGAPNAKGQRFHAGKDWFAEAGEGIVSPVAGRIIEVKKSRGKKGQVYGGVVKVQDAQGRVFVFRHVVPVGVRVGQKVKPNKLVAMVSPWEDGSSHAHVEIWKTREGGYRYENMLDPAAFFGR